MDFNLKNEKERRCQLYLKRRYGDKRAKEFCKNRKEKSNF
jgi:hypothetical protein